MITQRWGHRRGGRGEEATPLHSRPLPSHCFSNNQCSVMMLWLFCVPLPRVTTVTCCWEWHWALYLILAIESAHWRLSFTPPSHRWWASGTMRAVRKLYFHFRRETDIPALKISGYRYQSNNSMLCIIHTLIAYFVVRGVLKKQHQVILMRNSIITTVISHFHTELEQNGLLFNWNFLLTMLLYHCCWSDI